MCSWTLSVSARALLETLVKVSHEETVFYIEKNGVGANKKEIEKLHRVFNHKEVKNMEYAFRNARRLDSLIRYFWQKVLMKK